MQQSRGRRDRATAPLGALNGIALVVTRQHGGGLSPVALKRLHHQRKPDRIGEQTDRDLGLQPAFLGQAGLAKRVGGPPPRKIADQRPAIRSTPKTWPKSGI